MRRLSSTQVGVVKALLFLLLLAPSVAATVRVFSGAVAEPVDFLTHVSGENAMRLLIATLLITPLARVSGWHWLVQLRRMIGLFAFYYVLLHFTVYLLLDLQLDFSLVVEDVTQRKYITVGFVAFLLLIPLAVTSNDALLRKIGAKRWQQLHRAVYVIVPLAVVHFWWQVKGDHLMQVIVYAALTALLLAARHPRIAEKIKRR